MSRIEQIIIDRRYTRWEVLLDGKPIDKFMYYSDKTDPEEIGRELVAYLVKTRGFDPNITVKLRDPPVKPAEPPENTT